MSKQVSCLRDNVCATNASSLYINCGGKRFEDGNKVYEGDVERGGAAASHFSSTGSRWGFSNTGHFLGNGRDDYILPNPSTALMSNTGLYNSARASAISLTYYGFCMRNGSYNVSLHFAEIILTDKGTYGSLGRRVFDIYIQGKLVEKDFDISEKAGGVGKVYVSTHSVYVTGTLEIRLFWAGKGTTNIPVDGVYGPLISAISVDPNYPVPREDGPGNLHGVSGGIVAGIVVAAVCCIVLILGVLWWWGYLRRRDTMDLELSGITCSFTLRQIKAATNNFDVANKIGEGGFGSVYKGVLPDGTLIAVKQLSSKSRQGNREFLNELGMVSALQHPHLVKLHGCCIEGNQLLLVYEYMENNSLARALFGPTEWQLELDWPTRYRICIDIARGMSFLHEESRFKIVHRDIKVSNVLLDKNLNAKISDFGLAKLDEEDNTHIITRIAGTYGYMAPEYAMRGYLTDKADVYSYGIVLLEIVSGMVNTVDRSKQNHFILLDQAISLKNGGDLMELVDPRLGSDYDIQEMKVVINLALLCTTDSPTDRPTMSEVVSMLEGRAVTRVFVVEPSISTTELDSEETMKQLESMTESQIEEIKLESIMRSFLWTQGEPINGRCRLAWDKVCRPTDCGGLGFKRLSVWNRALVAKNLWDILSSRPTMWVNWINRVCFNSMQFWIVKPHSSWSWVFRKMLELRTHIRPYIHKEIRDGHTTHAWEDSWLQCGALAPLVSYRQIHRQGFIVDMSVLDVIDTWPNDWVMRYQPLATVPLPPIRDNVPDLCRWRSRSNGLVDFTVKDAYVSLDDAHQPIAWTKRVWFPGHILKHSFCLWLACSLRLPTHDRMLAWKHEPPDWKCALCGTCMDSHDHLFFQCVYSTEVWSIITAKVGWNDAPTLWSRLMDCMGESGALPEKFIHKFGLGGHCLHDMGGAKQKDFHGYSETGAYPCKGDLRCGYDAGLLEEDVEVIGGTRHLEPRGPNPRVSILY
ncbi:LOW QUALITY PROTEIN: hypothetical protein OSB04_005957 [Centaurea solstitialis]|uniref:non-specific serine/threonine protein kinase n=1 Tax=Centaurea solstitialis TaxID=347529 RepID=A0AA38WGZ1_9ASTR|nr:LOW QUALITY PROTEIN: hypothetical protein OSB04_005957 [Centaurea solstitialis]